MKNHIKTFIIVLLLVTTIAPIAHAGTQSSRLVGLPEIPATSTILVIDPFWNFNLLDILQKIVVNLIQVVVQKATSVANQLSPKIEYGTPNIPNTLTAPVSIINNRRTNTLPAIDIHLPKRLQPRPVARSTGSSQRPSMPPTKTVHQDSIPRQENPIIDFTESKLKKGEDSEVRPVYIDNSSLRYTPTHSNKKKLKAFKLENLGEHGNIGGEQTWTIKNKSRYPAVLFIYTKRIRNREHGCNDQELAAEPACDADNHGELGGLIELFIAIDGEDYASTILEEGYEDTVAEALREHPAITLQPHESVDVTAHWELDEGAYGNEIQSDSVRFNMVFRLIQVTSDGRILN